MMPTQLPDPNKPYDNDTTMKTVSGALIKLVMMGFRDPATPPSDVDGEELMTAIREGLLGGTLACAEVNRMREALKVLRDAHRPRPHADPTAPGALCETCSLHGALIVWPCETWRAADQILTKNQT
jgi:hypothetical protein